MSHPVHPADHRVLALTASQPDFPEVRPATDGNSVTPEYRAKAEAAAEKFEGYFIGQLLWQMRRCTREITDDDGIYGSRANGDLLDMADVLVGEALARRRAFGIADIILRQLLPAPSLFKEPAAPVAPDKRQVGVTQRRS